MCDFIEETISIFLVDIFSTIGGLVLTLAVTLVGLVGGVVVAAFNMVGEVVSNEGVDGAGVGLDRFVKASS
jgi:hypothetical protein